MFTPGQILGFETRTLHSAACAFFDQRVSKTSEASSIHLKPEACFSTLLVTPDLLDDGIWPIVGKQPVSLPAKAYPFGRVLRLRRILRLFDLEQSVFTKNLERAVIHGSGVVADFLDAFYGLRPWDDWYRSDYLDGLLFAPDKKPKSLIYCGRHDPTKGEQGADGNPH